MRRTEEYANEIKNFRNAMRGAQDAANKRLEELKKYEGSEGYEDDKKTIFEQRDNAIAGIQREYREKLLSITEKMGKAAYDMPITEPTEGQLRLLQVLKMRENLTYDEIRQAEGTLKDCPVCLEVLRELSDKHKCHYRVSGYMSTADILKGVDELKRSAETVTSMPLVDNRQGYLKSPVYHADGFEGGTKYFAVDRDFEGTKEAIQTLGCVQDFSAFSAVVDS